MDVILNEGLEQINISIDQFHGLIADFPNVQSGTIFVDRSEDCECIFIDKIQDITFTVDIKFSNFSFKDISYNVTKSYSGFEFSYYDMETAETVRHTNTSPLYDILVETLKEEMYIKIKLTANYFLNAGNVKDVIELTLIKLDPLYLSEIYLLKRELTRLMREKVINKITNTKERKEI